MVERLYVLQLTRSELELVHTEFNASVECGAEDADFPRVRDKAAAALQAADGVRVDALAGLSDYLRLMAHSQSAPEKLLRWADEVDRIAGVAGTLKENGNG